jgi:membrane-associated phospholipid phosphatase
MPEQVAPPGPAPTRRHGRPLLELGLVAAGLVAYLAVRWATAGRTDEAVANARDVLALEQALHLDLEHGIQAATLTAAWLTEVATLFYVWGYFPAVIAVTLWLYVRDRDAYRTLRTALLVSGALGLLVYATFPCAPPWLTDPAYTDTVADASLTGLARPGAITNELGALPSFHCGWLVVAAAVLFVATRSRLVRVVCVAWPALMAYAVVATGNHWVLDVPAGLAIAGVGVLVAMHASAARPPETPRTPG